MAAISTIIAGASLALGAGTAYAANKRAKKQASAQAAAQQKQENQAKNAAALDATRDGTGADVVFGTNSASDALLRRGARPKKQRATTGPGPARVGGLV